MENFQTEVSDSGFSLEKIMDPDRDPGCLESLDPVRAERLDPDPVNIRHRIRDPAHQKTYDINHINENNNCPVGRPRLKTKVNVCFYCYN